MPILGDISANEVGHILLPNGLKDLREAERVKTVEISLRQQDSNVLKGIEILQHTAEHSAAQPLVEGRIRTFLTETHSFFGDLIRHTLGIFSITACIRSSALVPPQAVWTWRSP